ncbi:MAG: hypothetical protein H6623_07645 [Bdellovibrionaceae bacterium]|nr:hypothetical protein [Pseudobdellovibrionaceae bacterium]
MTGLKMNLAIVAGLALTLVGCGSNSFSIAGDEATFTQNTKATSVPIDILWVVDNSGSMETSQSQVAANVLSFIDKFKQTNFDFRIAVTTTEAYQALPLFTSDESWSRFRDGTDATGYSGIKIITPTTPNIEAVFDQNIKQGINGSADERGFQSLEAALLNTQNRAEFPRAGAYLAVIFMTDEEDFSWDGTANIQLDAYGNPNSISDSRLISYQHYLDVLDQATGSTATKKNYVVNTIAIFDEACRAQLATEFAGRRIADRYAQLTDATGGVKASLCDDFSGILSSLSDTILEFSTKFYLDRVPNVDTLQIFVNDIEMPKEGYVYSADDNSITFKTGYIPAQDAVIKVKFLPTTLKN